MKKRTGALLTAALATAIAGFTGSGEPVRCEGVAPYFGSNPQPSAFDMAALERLSPKSEF